jgi:hypothetical protein
LILSVCHSEVVVIINFSMLKPMKRYVSNFQSSCLLGRFRLSRLSVAYMTNRDEYTDVELLIGRSLNRVLRLDSTKK